jgi:hypothetical protein
MKDPRMKGVESAQPGFKMLKKAAMRKSEGRSQRKRGKRGKRHHSKY